MTSLVARIAAEAEKTQPARFPANRSNRPTGRPATQFEETNQTLPESLPVHSFAAPLSRQSPHPIESKQHFTARSAINTTVRQRPTSEELHEHEHRTYRGRTVAMLRRYMKYSIETGRLPSLLGREFFRTHVTSYSVGTFEDRVIFVHDMEMCLQRLDEFSRQLIARHILQEHDRWATARLLHCNEKTVRRLTPQALDRLSGILLEMGLMERVESMETNSCQEGEEDEHFVSDCEEGK
jgi:hypothetical protein